MPPSRADVPLQVKIAKVLYLHVIGEISEAEDLAEGHLFIEIVGKLQVTRQFHGESQNGRQVSTREHEQQSKTRTATFKGFVIARRGWQRKTP